MGIRLENYLFRSDVGTYSEINEIISNDRVKVNGVVQNDNNYKVDVESDFVDIDGKLLSYRKHAYLMVNKPYGYVCQENDRRYISVTEKLPAWCARRGMKAANFVDREMTGLVLVTDDIGCNNYFSLNKRRLDLVYHVQTDKPVAIKDVEAFSSGMKMKHFTGEIATLSKAESFFKEEYAVHLTTKEISYRDIKKMFITLGINVLSAELIAVGDLVMPLSLDEGQWRELSADELSILNIKNPYK